MARTLYYNYKKSFPLLRVSASFRDFLRETQDKCLVSRLIMQGCVRIGRYSALDKKGQIVMNYISFRPNSGEISYMPAGRTQEINDSGGWVLKGRQTISPAKFARKILCPRIAVKLKDHHFADFASHFKANDAKNVINFKTVTVKHAYLDSILENKWGRSTGSCMNGHNVHIFYDKFDTCVLIAENEAGKYIGRALLWNNVTINNKPAKFMDRIYAAGQPEVEKLFLEWAEENGYHSKRSQNGENHEDLISPDGDTIKNPIIVARKIRNKKGYAKTFLPYLDTLEYVSPLHDTISNIFKVEKNVYLQLKNSEGGVDNLKDRVYAKAWDHWLNAEIEDIFMKENVIFFKGAGYSRRYAQKIKDVAINKFLNMKPYHVDDKRIFKASTRDKWYLKKEFVEIDGQVYHKSSSVIEKTKNNKWRLKKIEEPTIEEIKNTTPINTDITKELPHTTSYGMWGTRIISTLGSYRYWTAGGISEITLEPTNTWLTADNSVLH